MSNIRDQFKTAQEEAQVRYKAKALPKIDAALAKFADDLPKLLQDDLAKIKDPAAESAPKPSNLEVKVNLGAISDKMFTAEDILKMPGFQKLNDFCKAPENDLKLAISVSREHMKGQEGACVRIGATLAYGYHYSEIYAHDPAKGMFNAHHLVPRQEAKPATAITSVKAEDKKEEKKKGFFSRFTAKP